MAWIGKERIQVYGRSGTGFLMELGVYVVRPALEWLALLTLSGKEAHEPYAHRGLSAT